MKKYIYIFLFVIIVLLISGLLYFFIPMESNISNSLQAIGVFGALIISIIALVCAIMEFIQHKKEARTTLICQYMHRYATDENVQKIKQYIHEKSRKDEDGYIEGFDDNAKTTYEPTSLEKEQFMLVFEELQLCIDANMIPLKKAIDIFGYYVSVFHYIPKFHSGVTDYEDENYWKHYLKFANSIQEDFYRKHSNT